LRSQHLSPVPDSHLNSNDAPGETVYDVSLAMAVLKRAASSTVPKEKKYIAMALRRKIFLIDFMILDGRVR